MSAEESMEVITLDDSEIGNQMNGSVEIIGESRAAPNLSVVVDETRVGCDATLPPGAAPSGFVIVDEEVVNVTSEPVEAPIFKVAFRDDKAFQKYNKEIEGFLKDLLKNRYDKEKTTSSAKNLSLQIFESDITADNSPQPVEGPDGPPIDFYFTLDSEPKVADELDIPVYGKKFNKALEKGKENAPEEKDENAAPRLTCFNCLGNHSLRDCPEPRNFVEISKNRKDYYNVRRVPSSARYHLDEDQKFGHFAPGQMSSKLRKALGLKDNELPHHIYRMRMLGYPPGWLEEARLQHSGLTLFNSEGVADQGSDEEGEIVVPGDKDQYDIKKIIDYPGFNVPPPEGVKDEFMQYWGSMEQLNSSKEAMEASLSHKKVDDGYKRKKFPNPANSRSVGNLNSGEMEVEAVEESPVECVPVKDLFIPPLPREDGSDAPPPPPPVEEDANTQDNSKTESNASSLRVDSPSLFDLENAKTKLLAELNDSSSHSNPDSEKTEEPKADASNGDKNLDSSKTEVPEPSSLNTSSVNCETPKNSPKPGSGHNTVKSVHMGTPVLSSCSPFSRLPTSEKFSKNICDVINFENLPDSTGKYDQMSELLHKVRRTLSDLHKE